MRVWRRVTLVGLAGLAVLALAAYAARRDIVAHFAKDLLSRRGYPDAVLEAAEVTPWRSRFVAVAAAGLQAERVTLHYDPLGLLAGQVSRIEVEAPRLELDLTGPAPGRAVGIPTLPRLRVTAGRLDLVLPQGRLPIDIEADLETGTDGRIGGEARFSGGSEIGNLRGRLSRDLDGALALELDAGLGAASPLWADLGLPAPESGELRSEVRLSARPDAVDRPPDSPAQWLRLALAGNLAGDLRLRLDDLLWAGLDRPISLEVPLALDSAADALEMTLPAEIDLGDLPDLGARLEAPGLPADLLRAFAGATRLSLTKDTAAAPVIRLAPAPEGGGVLSFEGRAGIEVAGRPALAAAGRARLVIGPSLRPGAFRIDGLDARLGGLAVDGQPVDGPAVDVRALEAARFTGALRGDAGTLAAEGSLEIALLDLEIAPFRFGRSRFEGPVAIDAGAEGAMAALTGDGTLSWEEARSAVAVTLPAAHRLRLTGFQARHDGEALSYEAALDPGDMVLKIEDPERPLDLEAAFQPLQIAGRWSEAQGLALEARIPVRRLSVPQLGLEARDVLAAQTLEPAAGVATIAATVGTLGQTRPDATFAPLKVEGRLDHADSPLTFAGTGSTPAGLPLFSLQGRHDVDRGQGSARIVLDRDLFGPAPRRLPELLPAAPDLTVTAGRIEGEAEIAWRGGDLQGQARLGLVEVDAKSPALTLVGLTGELAFPRLFPLASAPGQTLRAARLDLGETLTDLSARFTVSAQGPERRLVVEVERAEARSILGPLSVAGGRAEPQSGRYRLPLRLADLDLGRLSATAAIEGLAGEGRLSGLIPLEIAGARLTIRDAGLSNRGNGVLRFRSETAARALAAGGEPVELMLRALEDFRYEELKLSADTTDGEELELFITTLGQNPAVLEGHPFRFNIRLTSSLPQLVEVLREGGGLTRGVLGRLWKFQP